jgi:hypothetical protein
LAEREAMSALFAGAMGHCKNPSSHREVDMDRVSAARLIAFASYLLSQVDSIENLIAAGVFKSAA